MQSLLFQHCLIKVYSSLFFHWKPLTVSGEQYAAILDSVVVRNFCFYFSRVLVSVVDYVNVDESAHVAYKPCLG